jgi:calcium binding protein 39
LIVTLIDNFSRLPFESKKDLSLVFNNLLRQNAGNFVTFIENNLVILDLLVDGYENPDIALNSGTMLRECVNYESLSRALLTSPNLILFFDKFVHFPNFDVASDAFNTLRDLLTTPKNRNIASEYLEKEYETFVSNYEKLLTSENYVTRRRSLKLLSSILLDRVNFSIMIRYVSSRQNLKLIMNQLRDVSYNIQYEAFHVFKIFVAYPNKPLEISTVLFRNKVKLVAYLESFPVSEDEDHQFLDEINLLIETLSCMEDPSKSISTK